MNGPKRALPTSAPATAAARNNPILDRDAGLLCSALSSLPGALYGFSSMLAILAAGGRKSPACCSEEEAGPAGLEFQGAAPLKAYDVARANGFNWRK